MFPGARKLPSVFTARMGSRPFATIAAAGTHVVVAIAAGVHPRFAGAYVCPAPIALDLRVSDLHFAGTMVSC